MLSQEQARVAADSEANKIALKRLEFDMKVQKGTREDNNRHGEEECQDRKEKEQSTDKLPHRVLDFVFATLDTYKMSNEKSKPS